MINTITTIQEITLEAYSFGIFNYLFEREHNGMSRDEIFNLFEEWGKEFEQIEKEHEGEEDWFYYDEIDEFLNKKFIRIKLDDAIPGGVDAGDYITYEGSVYKITALTDRGIAVDEIAPGKDKRWIVTEIGISECEKAKVKVLDESEVDVVAILAVPVGSKVVFRGGVYEITGTDGTNLKVREIVHGYGPDNTKSIDVLNSKGMVKPLTDYDEIMDTGNGHNEELVEKVNALWNFNRESFRPILVALYERDIDEITNSDAFQEKSWHETPEYEVGCDTGNWGAYNDMAFDKMSAEWDYYAYNYLMHIADDADLECIIKFLR